MARPPGRLRASAALVLAVLLLAVNAVTAAPEGAKPALSHTLFDNLPSKILYFDDSPVSYPSPWSRSRGRASGAKTDWERGGGRWAQSAISDRGIPESERYT